MGAQGSNDGDSITRNGTRVLLVQPRVNRGHGTVKHEGNMAGAPLTLAYLAGLTPPEYDVAVVDENVAEIDFDAPVDIVGISAVTMAAPRAYEVSRRFRSLGAKVVIGGVHATLLPEEAAQHADAIVIGEAEDVWQQLLADFRNGGLKPTYRRGEAHSLAGLAKPRWDLLNKSAYLTTNVVQTTRGCPYDCSFCSVTTTFGRKYRRRPVEDVVKEFEATKGKLVGFADADITANPKYSIELFDSIAPYKKWWAADAGIGVANQPDVLKAAAKSGCKGFYIGFESVSSDSLAEANKAQNTKRSFEDSIKIIHDHGIAVLGGFIFGFDTDDESVFERTVEFAIENKMIYADFNVLCPYPGTRVYDKMLEEDRLLETDWSKYYGMSSVVFRPKKMSAERLREGCQWAWREFYSARSIAGRFVSRRNLTSLFNPISYLIINVGTRRGVSGV